MEIGSINSLSLESGYPASADVLVEADWETDTLLEVSETFEIDQSNTELTPIAVEYAESTDGFYPVSINSEDMIDSDAKLVLTDEQEGAVEEALAGGSATVEILTPFGTDKIEVWSIQTYTSSGITSTGERCFTLSAITEEREIPILEQEQHRDDYSNEIIVHSDDSGGDIVVEFSIEHTVLDDEVSPVFEVVVDDTEEQANDSAIDEVESLLAPESGIEATLFEDKVEGSIASEAHAIPNPIPELYSPIVHSHLENYVRQENMADGDTYSTVLETAAVAENETTEEHYQLEQDSDNAKDAAESLTAGVSILVPVLEEYAKETETEMSPLRDTATSIVSVTPEMIFEAEEMQMEAAASVEDLEESESIQPQTVTTEQEQPQEVVSEGENYMQTRQQDLINAPPIEHHTQPAEEPIKEMQHTEIERAIPVVVYDERPAVEVHSKEATYDEVPEIAMIVDRNTEHSDVTHASDVKNKSQKEVKNVDEYRVSPWELSGFESTYGFYPTSALDILVEDDIVIPFETARGAKTLSLARQMRSRVA